MSVCMSQLLQGDPSWSRRAVSKFGGSEVAQRAALGGRVIRSEVVMTCIGKGRVLLLTVVAIVKALRNNRETNGWLTATLYS